MDRAISARRERKCMREAVKVFAGADSDGIPPEVVRAMLQY